MIVRVSMKKEFQHETSSLKSTFDFEAFKCSLPLQSFISSFLHGLICTGIMAPRRKNVTIPEEKKIQILYWMIENKEDLIHENDVNHPSYKTKKCHAHLLEYINQLLGFSAYPDYSSFRYISLTLTSYCKINFNAFVLQESISKMARES